MTWLYKRVGWLDKGKRFRWFSGIQVSMLNKGVIIDLANFLIFNWMRVEVVSLLYDSRSGNILLEMR